MNPKENGNETEVTEVLGLPFAKLTPKEAARVAAEKIKKGGFYAVFTPGATIHARAFRRKEEMRLLTAADLVLPDGQGVVLASRLAGAPLDGRCAGISFAECLLAMAEKGTRFFFYGGKEGVAAEAAARMKEKHPHLSFAWACGYGKDPISEILAFSPHILFVCLGYPRQEEYILSHKSELACLCAGLGGSLDVWSGRVSRAPVLLQKHGLEWVYRTLKEPRRISRLVPLPTYYLAAWRQGLKKRRKPSADRG